MSEPSKSSGIPWGAIASVAVAGVIMVSWGYYLLSSGSAAAPAPPAGRNAPGNPPGNATAPISQPTPTPPPQTSPQELKAKIDAGTKIVLIDVRSQQEFSASRLKGTISIPLTDIETRFSEVPKGAPIVVYANCA